MAVNGNVKVKEKSNQKGIVKFFKELKAEAKRITWPSKKILKRQLLQWQVFLFFL